MSVLVYRQRSTAYALLLQLLNLESVQAVFPSSNHGAFFTGGDPADHVPHLIYSPVWTTARKIQLLWVLGEAYCHSQIQDPRRKC